MLFNTFLYFKVLDQCALFFVYSMIKFPPTTLSALPEFPSGTVIYSVLICLQNPFICSWGGSGGLVSGKSECGCEMRLLVYSYLNDSQDSHWCCNNGQSGQRHSPESSHSCISPRWEEVSLCRTSCWLRHHVQELHTALLQALCTESTNYVACVVT